MKHSLAIFSIVPNAGPLPVREAVMSSSTRSSTSLSLKILIALMGSPTYLGLRNSVVFTNPAPRSKRLGMTRVFSISGPLHEIAEEQHSVAMALFRMKLGAHQIIVLK